jgi:hypothetical protein
MAQANNAYNTAYNKRKIKIDMCTPTGWLLIGGTTIHVFTAYYKQTHVRAGGYDPSSN